MLDICTVPQGNAIPFVDQLPAQAVFDTKEQHVVAMTIGNQQEKEYQDRRHQKLMEFQARAQLIADPRSLLPKTKAPQEYDILVCTAALGTEKDRLLPRGGDSAHITLTGVFAKKQDVPNDMKDHLDKDIAAYIEECVEAVSKDRSIQTLDEYKD
jgi:hypothetical protein